MRGTEEPLERSDIFRTANPTWVPPCGFSGCRQHVFEVRAVDARSQKTLWSQALDLSQVQPFCEDLETHGHSPPLAVPLVQLSKQWFTLPVWLEKNGSPAISSTLEPRRPRGVVKQVKASDVCGAGDRISEMLDGLHQHKVESSALRDAMECCLTERHALRQRRQRRLSTETRLRLLRHAVDIRRKNVEILKAELSEAHDSSNNQDAQRQQAREELARATEEQRLVVAGLTSTYISLKSLWLQLRCRQMRMIHEVCQVYPIEKHDKYWTIRGLNVLSIDMLGRQDLREEENVSTALGYIVHMLVTLSGILEVPLRIDIHQAGCSRSFLCDPHEAVEAITAAPREFPLYYGRGLEKPRFEAALRLLRDGLHQFLYSRGYLDERRLRSGSLLECAKLILTRELFGVQSPPT